MKEKSTLAEEDAAQLAQDATNESTPEKALEERPKRPIMKRKTALPRKVVYKV